ncbi:fumarylacetoacetate hydrolase family protein [Paenibacillus thalictri]|uniref:DUF2437 domain-containing protein n=1 Tax=Paenibacillus thalictri TaxID=2527873 RepID=A0A4V2J3A6_9BACL|nr:fumarylacetoacetate hydrolase family protein [Paenibacillus thalictri]TBL70788.1 DUF2437 domain-containing protein [Paenibacillus thalictri]
MKFARFVAKGHDTPVTAIVQGDELHVIEGCMFDQWQRSGEIVPLSEAKLLAPLVPTSIIGIGKNYIAPGEQKPEKLPDIPVLFYKPVSSVIGPGEAIIIPNGLDEVKFESELAVVIGRAARNVSEEEALDYVFGYTVGNDVTAPQLFHPEGHWLVGKSADTFTPLGPVIETELNPDQVVIQATHNGILKQNSPIDLIIVSVRYLISYLSRYMTLQPGDVILTGSPAGAVMMEQGDTIECAIEGIGVLQNHVAK